MNIIPFALCIAAALGGVWMFDLGATASAYGIWVIAIILAIDGAASAVVKSSALDQERHRTLSTPSLGRSTVSTKIVAEGGWGIGGLTRSTPPPPPPKKPANPFKVGDHVLFNGSIDGRVVAVAGMWVKHYQSEDKHHWVSADDCVLIENSEKRPLKVGDRVRMKSELGGGTVGEIISITEHGTATVDFGPTPPLLLWLSIEFPLDSLELICEKQS